MTAPKMNDPVTRMTGATSATAAVTYRATPNQINAIQVNASGSAAGTLVISASLDGTEFPVVKTITLSAGSRHLIWFESMPVHWIKIDPAGVSAGSVDVITAGTTE